MQTVNKWISGEGINTLTLSEMEDPVSVLKGFSADYPLLSMKELFSTMTDLCVMAEDVCSTTAIARQPLFKLSTRIIKVLEAVYLIARKDNVIATENSPLSNGHIIRKVRVLEGRGDSRRGKPVITFCGNWLYESGFHIGDEVKIVAEAGHLLLSLSRRWSRSKQEWLIRA